MVFKRCDFLKKTHFKVLALLTIYDQKIWSNKDSYWFSKNLIFVYLGNKKTYFNQFSALSDKCAPLNKRVNILKYKLKRDIAKSRHYLN